MYKLLIQSSGCLRLFLRCLVLALCSGCSCCCHSLPLRLSSCTLFRFSLYSRKVTFLLRLSCLSLVFVWCSPASFFPFGFVSCISPLCCLFLRLSGSFFSIVCCLLRSVVSSLYSPLPFIAAVALAYASSGFLVSLLACFVLLPRSSGVFSLLSYGFFLILFACVCHLSVFTFGSHLLVRPGATLFVF